MLVVFCFGCTRGQMHVARDQSAQDWQGRRRLCARRRLARRHDDIISCFMISSSSSIIIIISSSSIIIMSAPSRAARRWRSSSSASRAGCARRPGPPSPEGNRYRDTANLPKILHFRGFYSSIILILRAGIPRPMGNFPESLSQAILVGIIIVGRLGVQVAASFLETPRWSMPCSGRR